MRNPFQKSNLELDWSSARENVFKGGEGEQSERREDGGRVTWVAGWQRHQRGASQGTCVRGYVAGGVRCRRRLRLVRGVTWPEAVRVSAR